MVPLQVRGTSVVAFDVSPDALPRGTPVPVPFGERVGAVAGVLAGDGGR